MPWSTMFKDIDRCLFFKNFILVCSLWRLGVPRKGLRYQNSRSIRDVEDAAEEWDIDEEDLVDSSNFQLL